MFERWLPVLRASFLYAGLIVGLVALPGPAQPNASDSDLHKQIEKVIDGPAYKHATWGILVVNAKTGETVYERNPETMLAPASVTKLFTCAAALIALGEDSTTKTKVFQNGKMVGDTLRGDLILVAAGDLTFGSRFKDGKTVFKDKDHTYANSGLGDSELTDTDPLYALNTLAKQVKEAGINQIDGEILIDDRLFARTRGSGSGPDTISPMIINDNAVDILIEPGPNAGDPAKITTRPESGFYQVDALVTTGPAKSAPAIQLLPVSSNQIAIRGRVPVGGNPQVRIYPIEEPALFARALFIEALRRNHVKATAPILRPVNTSFSSERCLCNVDPDRFVYFSSLKGSNYCNPQGEPQSLCQHVAMSDGGFARFHDSRSRFTGGTKDSQRVGSRYQPGFIWWRSRWIASRFCNTPGNDSIAAGNDKKRGMGDL